LNYFPEWVTRPEQGMSSGSLWTSIFWDGISSTPDEIFILQWIGVIAHVHKHLSQNGRKEECEIRKAIFIKSCL